MILEIKVSQSSTYQIAVNICCKSVTCISIRTSDKVHGRDIVPLIPKWHGHPVVIETLAGDIPIKKGSELLVSCTGLQLYTPKSVSIKHQCSNHTLLPYNVSPTTKSSVAVSKNCDLSKI